jgi:hypothetical protein
LAGRPLVALASRRMGPELTLLFSRLRRLERQPRPDRRPNGGAENLFGVNAMDPALRAPAARAGFEQGQRPGQLLAAFWR